MEQKLKYPIAGFAKIIAIITIIFAIAILIVSQRKLLNTAAELGKEEVMQGYIEYLSTAGKDDKIMNLILPLIEVAGMGTDSDGLPAMTLEEAEKQGLLNNISEEMTAVKKEYFLAVANQQHKLVVKQFGEDAWKNVSFTLEKIEPIDGKLGYRLKATGEIISKEAYDMALKVFWTENAKKENLDFYDLFLKEGESVGNMQYKRVDIIDKYIQDLPAELILISDTETYQVNLKFDGEAESSEGYKDFHFIIDNRNGQWTVFDGLTWSEPFPEFPTGD